MTALLLSFFTSGMDTLLPLWVTRDLGYDAGQWAQLRSLRFTGVLVGVVLLGALSDRFGQRKVGAYSFFGAAIIYAVLGLGWQQGLWMLIPVLGALVSTVFVNLNSLIQLVSSRRQGLANTIYRSVGAAAVIGAPFTVTWLAARWHGYPPVLLVLAGFAFTAGCVLLKHPDDVAPTPFGNIRDEAARLWTGYRSALRERNLVVFIHLSQIWGNLFAGVGAFTAIRFTQDLGLSDQQFGILGTCSGIVVFLATAGTGFFLDRISIRRMHGVLGTIAGICCVMMGIGNSLSVSIIGFIGFSALMSMLVGPGSMWISRAAGESSQTSAFSVQKVISAIYLSLSMILASLLEGWIGMRLTILYGGIIGAVTALSFFLLPEPPPQRRFTPETRKRDSASPA